MNIKYQTEIVWKVKNIRLNLLYIFLPIPARVIFVLLALETKLFNVRYYRFNNLVRSPSPQTYDCGEKRHGNNKDLENDGMKI